MRAAARRSLTEDPNGLSIVLGPFEVKGGQEISFASRLMHAFHLEALELDEGQGFVVEQIVLSNPPMSNDDDPEAGAGSSVVLAVTSKNVTLYKGASWVAAAGGYGPGRTKIDLGADSEPFDLLTTIIRNQTEMPRLIKVTVRGRRR